MSVEGKNLSELLHDLKQDLVDEKDKAAKLAYQAEYKRRVNVRMKVRKKNYAEKIRIKERDKNDPWDDEY